MHFACLLRLQLLIPIFSTTKIARQGRKASTTSAGQPGGVQNKGFEDCVKQYSDNLEVRARDHTGAGPVRDVGESETV